MTADDPPVAAVERKLTEAEAFALDCLRHSGYPGKWMRPMDLGRPSSFVWRGLNGLVKRGVVERRSRRGHGPTERGSYVYRLVDGASQ